MKFFKTLMFIAAAAMAFTACSTEEGVVEKSGVKVSFTAVDTQTRTSFGEADGTNYPTLWTGNEKVIIGLNNISNGSTVQAAITTEDNKSAHWEAESTDDEPGSYNHHDAAYERKDAVQARYGLRLLLVQEPGAEWCHR